MLISFNHLLIRQRQSRRLVLRSTTLIRNYSLKALLIVRYLVDFLASFATEVHALHLLGRLLQGLPVVLGGAAVDR